MNYSQLSTAIQDYCQNSEATFVNHINDFIIATEDIVYASVEGPMYFKVDITQSTVDGTNFYALADGTIDVLSIRLCETAAGSVLTDGPVRYLDRKDLDYLYEAYPGTAASGLEKTIPKVYSVTSASDNSGEPRMSIRLGPTPDDAYNMAIEYYGKATTDSITYGSTPAAPLTTTTWLSTAFPDVLMWGSILQGYIFMKGDADILQSYQTKFNDGLMLLNNMGENRMAGDKFGTVEPEAAN